MNCLVLPKRLLQKCPFCNQEQIILIRGWVLDLENCEPNISHDKGYSFCNCKNIFYTDYKNIDKTVYDERYNDKYNQSENLKIIANNEIEKLYPIFKQVYPQAKVFFELGAIHDYILNFMKDKGYEVHGLNISSNRESKHDIMIVDFEKIEELPYKPDIIFASHIFEHFKDPGKELDKCRRMLSDEGFLYVAMPDTFFIDFEHSRVQEFDWFAQEHHILWNMDNWIEFCEEHGFKCVWSERCLDMHKQIDKDWFWKKDFKVICLKSQ